MPGRAGIRFEGHHLVEGKRAKKGGDGYGGDKEDRFQHEGKLRSRRHHSHGGEEVSGSGVNSGTVTVFVAGSTAGVSTIEFEPGLISDFQSMWERAVPRGIPYQHDRAWGDGNGFSHVRASFRPLADSALHQQNPGTGHLATDCGGGF